MTEALAGSPPGHPNGQNGAAKPNGRGRDIGLIGRLLRALRSEHGGAVSAVEAVIREREDRGQPLALAQRNLILNAARFDELRVADVMTPRADIVALDASATLAEAAQLFADSQHSRLPLYRDTLDDPLGFVHVKDVLALLAPRPDAAAPGKPQERALVKLRREALFVPGSMRLPSLLLKMQTGRIHMALVVDEYGGTDGLVTIEDLMEQIVGDISDEHDEADVELISGRAGVLEADGRASVEELESRLGVSLRLADEEVEYDTVAGLASAILGRVPQRGELVRHPAGFDFEVLEADPRRLRRVRIKPLAQASEDPSP